MKKYDTKKYCTNKAEHQILKHRAILQYWLQYANNPLSVFLLIKSIDFVKPLAVL